MIVGAAVALLDEHGERGLTFRLLAKRLDTGPGALYWHVANKDELVALAAERVLGDALAEVPGGNHRVHRVHQGEDAVGASGRAGQGEDPGRRHAAAPADHRSGSSPWRPSGGSPDGIRRDEEPLAGLRALALSVFDALQRHPWAAVHVHAPATRPNALGLLDRIGTLVARSGLPAERHFAVSTALSYYVTGVSAQIITPRPTAGAPEGREAFLAHTAEHWEGLDPAEYPFLTQTTADLRDHDDRDQFLTGLDLLLAGLNAAVRPGPGSPA